MVEVEQGWTIWNDMGINAATFSYLLCNAKSALTHQAVKPQETERDAASGCVISSMTSFAVISRV
jgi:hypothetical protein